LQPAAGDSSDINRIDKFKENSMIKYIKMVNDRLGFALKTEGILRTVDGGNTWSQTYSFGNLPNQMDLDLTNPKNPFGIEFEFISPVIGWIAIGDSEKSNTMIFHTIDGGEKWDVHNIKATGIISLKFIVLIPPEAEPVTPAKLAQSICAKSPNAVRMAKEAIDQGLLGTLSEGLRLEAGLFGLCFVSSEQKEGMSAFLEKRPAFF
jgi:photosystem II stability/assembly factor-like uncharacterized protein